MCSSRQACILAAILLVASAWAQTPTSPGPKPTPEVQRLLVEAMKLPTRDQRDPLKRALEMARKLADKDGEAEALSRLGSVYGSVGQFKPALECYEQALPLARAVKDRACEGDTLNGIGHVYENSGHPGQALDYFNQALPIRREVKDRSGEANTLSGIGEAYGDLGQPKEALDYYNLALPIEREVKERRGEAGTLSNIGLVYDNLGKPEKALEYFNQALPIEREVKDRTGQTVTLENIGNVYRQTGNPAKALQYFNQALLIEREIKDRSGQASTLNFIGAVYWGLDQFKRALDYFNQALPIYREVEDRSGEAGALSNIGNIYGDMARPDKALEFYNQALPIEREMNARTYEVKTLNNIGWTLKDLNFNRAAIAAYKLSVNVYQSLRLDAKGLPTELQDSFKKEQEHTYRELAGLLAAQGRLAEAQGVMDLLKDDEYFKSLGTAKAQEVDLTPKETQLKATYDTLGDELAIGATELESLEKLAKRQPLSKEQLARKGELGKKIEASRQAFQAFLKTAETAFASAGAEKDRIEELKTYTQLASIVSSLPGRPAAIYTLVTRDGVRTILTLPNVTELKTGAEQKTKFEDLSKKIRLLRTALTDPRLDPVPVASELYDIVIRPLEKDLNDAGVQSLMFSLDGPLRYIPLGALYDRKTHQWLGQKYPLSLFTPANISRMKDDLNVPVSAAGFGVSLPHEVGGLHFSALSAVHAELASLSATLGAAIFEDEKFTATSLKAELEKSPSLLHLATHFELKGGDAFKSFLVLGDGKALSIADFAGLRKDVLKRCDLLVISACDTATPTGDGGEFESFARVAQDSGAAAVLATLWPVNDASTGLFMGYFYQLRKAHPEMTKTEALRQTQAWLMTCGQKELAGVKRNVEDDTPVKPSKALPLYKKDPKHPFAHPFYWAPFVLTGNVK